jgi:hypothetical protein
LAALRRKSYCCPADSTVTADGHSANQIATNTASPPYYFPWGASSYAANYQVFGTVNNFGAPNFGNYCGPKYDLNLIPDGAANTVFIGEVFSACGSTSGSLWAYPGIGNYSGTAYTRAPGAQAPAGVNDNIVNKPGATNSKLWTSVFVNGDETYGFTAGGVKGSSSDYNRPNPVRPFDAPYAACLYWDAPPQFGITPAQCDKARLQGLHTRAIIVCMGDGSVRVVAAGVSQATWYAAIVPDDGTPLGPDW